MTIQQILPESRYHQAVWQLREDVLRKPLGRSLRDEDLSGEAKDVVFAALEGDELVGCLLLRGLPEGGGKLRQMAVQSNYQGRGVGIELLQAAEAYALEEGLLYLELHARETAVGFYEKTGYRPSGTSFTEVGIPHLKMTKSLAQ